MIRYLAIAITLLTLFLLLFLAVEAYELPLLSDPSPWLAQGGWVAASIGIVLLVVDVLLPVPSSLVMIGHGALFGVWVGTLLSVVGSMGAAALGFALGWRGDSLLARVVPAAERLQAERILQRWGALAIIITRPIPLLAETVMILVGASRLGWGAAMGAALIGIFPGAVLYALAGAVAGNFQNSSLIFGFVLLFAGCFWLIGRWIGFFFVQPRSDA